MKDFMSIKGTMSSLQIAEVTGKRHDAVLRDIRNLLEQGVGRHNFVESSYLNSQNKMQPCYSMTIKGCLILASGYNALLREKIINRWEELEIAAKARKPRKRIAPRSRNERSGQFYDDLTQLVTHDDERAVAAGCGVTRSHVHEVLRGRRMGFIVLAELVARAKANRSAGIERVVPFVATEEMREQLVLNFYSMEG